MTEDLKVKNVDFVQLQAAVDWSMRQLKTPRDNRLAAIKEYVGSHYSDGGSELRVPTNFLELAVTIYSRQLAARAPQIMVTARPSQLKPQAKTMEIALNQLPEEIGLDATLRRAVVEALFAFAVVKVGVAASGEVVLGAEYGEAYADLVSIDDYFCDMSAKSRDAIQFEGNDYWLPIDDVRGMYNDPELQPDDHTLIDEQGGEHAASVTVTEGADLYKEKVWLRDVWLTRTNQLVTYAVVSKKLLKVIDWDGPDNGPYHVLGFADVPGNLLPLPPVALWLDLHELGNSLFRKLGRQADAKKTVAAFSGGNDEDVNALRNASDGDGVKYTGNKPEAITVGGIDSPTLAFYLQIRDLFNYFGGNLDSLGGLAASADTLGQDRLLSDASGARISQMRDETIRFVKSIVKALAWYEWTDPVRERSVDKMVKGTDLGVSVKWSEETREGDFLDYNFDIDVYSMQDNSPSMKLQRISQVMEQYVLPLMPMIQEQGGQIDVRELLLLVGKLSNVPELSDMVMFPNQEPGNGLPVQGNPNPEAEKPGMPAHTKRTYERVGKPGASRHGRDDVMSRLLMGGNVQPAEGAMI